jgi:hypothetical protein
VALDAAEVWLRIFQCPPKAPRRHPVRICSIDSFIVILAPRKHPALDTGRRRLCCNGGAPWCQQATGRRAAGGRGRATQRCAARQAPQPSEAVRHVTELPRALAALQRRALLAGVPDALVRAAAATGQGTVTGAPADGPAGGRAGRSAEGATVDAAAA